MNRKAMEQPRSTMHAVLWVAQVLWGIVFSFTGFGKILAANDAVWHQMLPRVAWFSAVGQPLFVFIGICEFLGGVGLILPVITGIKPKLTPLAGLGLTLVMILAAAFHVARGEYHFFLLTNLILGAGPAFVAYERLFVRPIAPAPLSTLRVVKGLAVLGVLAFAGFAPVWYQMAHKG